MNEEDKKIINKLKQTIDFNSSLYIDDLGDNDIKDILNVIERQQKLINQLIEDMKERANNFSYESEIMWRKIEKAEKLLKED